MQPRVISDQRAVLGVGGQPCRRRLINQAGDLKRIAIDLGRGLQRVAAIDEDGGLVRQRDGEPG